MTSDLDRLRKRINSLKEQAYQGKFILTTFVDTMVAKEIENSFKHNEELKPYSYGGYHTAEYKRYIFSNEIPKREDFQIVAIKIEYSKKNGDINHRSILGSILGLGLKREVVGDIICDKGNFYFFVTKQMENFILENLRYIGNVPVLLVIENEELSYEQKFDIKTCFLASMRLDVVLAAFYNLSRKQALEIISDGAVKVNHLECLNPSENLKSNDLLSVRHHGRLFIGEIKGKTKSGNLVVELKKPSD